MVALKSSGGSVDASDMARRSSSALRRFTTLAAVTLVASGCAALVPLEPEGAPAWSYFEAPEPGDVWTPQITGWQRRERALPSTEQLRPETGSSDDAVSQAAAPVPDGTRAAMLPPGVIARAGAAGGKPAADAKPPSSDLRQDWFTFRAEQKRALARNVAGWIQREARDHYLPDGIVDHWATLEETLARNGDDCDGLELLTFHFLLDLGFRQDEVYRAIVHHPADGQHHMVTFWFEDPEDPWVIDPTGAMTSGMPRLSQVAGWVPLKVFGETVEYTVRPGVAPARVEAAAAPH